VHRRRSGADGGRTERRQPGSRKLVHRHHGSYQQAAVISKLDRSTQGLSVPSTDAAYRIWACFQTDDHFTRGGRRLAYGGWIPHESTSVRVDRIRARKKRTHFAIGRNFHFQRISVVPGRRTGVFILSVGPSFGRHLDPRDVGLDVLVAWRRAGEVRHRKRFPVRSGKRSARWHDLCPAIQGRKSAGSPDS
jgi:hypothetical protein